jgi:hypothetical protein
MALDQQPQGNGEDPDEVLTVQQAARVLKVSYSDMLRPVAGEINGMLPVHHDALAVACEFVVVPPQTGSDREIRALALEPETTGADNATPPYPSTARSDVGRLKLIIRTFGFASNRGTRRRGFVDR